MLTKKETRKMFGQCETLEQLKAEYKRLAMKHHPDRGGNTETMQFINAEYDRRFETVKTIHKNMKGETYTKDTGETPEMFKDILEKLFNMDGIEIEIIGSFIWVAGNTKPHKDELKAEGFRWNGKRQKWFLAPDGWHSKTRRFMTDDELRESYGTSGTMHAQNKQRNNILYLAG